MSAKTTHRSCKVCVGAYVGWEIDTLARVKTVSESIAKAQTSFDYIQRTQGVWWCLYPYPLPYHTPRGLSSLAGAVWSTYSYPPPAIGSQLSAIGYRPNHATRAGLMLWTVVVGAPPYSFPVSMPETTTRPAPSEGRAVSDAPTGLASATVPCQSASPIQPIPYPPAFCYGFFLLVFHRQDYVDKTHPLQFPSDLLHPPF